MKECIQCGKNYNLFKKIFVEEYVNMSTIMKTSLNKKN